MHEQSLLFAEAAEKLSERGLNLIAVFDLAQLPKSIVATMEQSGADLSRFSRLVLLGNGGRLFFDELEKAELTVSDPIDTFSLHLTGQLIDEISAEGDINQIAYPQSSIMVPLQQLGELAGWGTPSPIGNSISAEYGLWFAFRSAFLTSIPLPPTRSDPVPSPCLTCVDKPCQTACPAGAVQQSSAEFKLQQCITHRLKDGSSCVETCLARLACPVGVEHRYPPHSISHLYRSSVLSIREWQGKN